MAKFPVYQRQVGLSGGATASFASEGAFTAPARALQVAGQTIAGVGQDFAAVVEKFNQDRDNSWLAKASAETVNGWTQEEINLRQRATGDASGYVETAQNAYGGLREQVGAGAPSKRARAAYDEWADKWSTNVVGGAARFRAESEVAQRNTDLTGAIEAGVQTVAADPTQYDTVYARSMAALDAARSWMTPEQEAKARTETQRVLNAARAKSVARLDPQAFLAETGQTTHIPAAKVAPDVATRQQQAMAFFTSKGFTKEQAAGIVGNLTAESNLQPSGAVGDNGTAFGIAQWRGDRLTKLKRFANATGRDWQDFNTQLEFVVIELEGDEIAAGSRLKQAQTVDEATAAFIGFERPQGWTSGNPRGGHNYKGRLAFATGAAGQEAVDFHEGGDFSADPRYAGMSVDEIWQMQDQAQASINATQTQQRAAVNDRFDLAIASGEPVSRDMIYGSGLDAGQQAALIRKLDARDEVAGPANALAGAIVTGGDASVNPFDARQAKIADKAYESVSAGAPPESMAAIAEQFVGRTGYVPKDLLSALRAGANSSDAATRASGMDMLDRIERASPSAFRAMTDSQALGGQLEHYRAMTGRGLTPEEAAKRLIEADKPATKASREQLKTSANTFVKDLSVDDVTGAFDTAMTLEPGAGVTVRQENAVLAEYKALAEDFYYETGGDAEAAKAKALAEMKRLYGVSSVSGSSQIMRRAPEGIYPAMDGSHDYIRADVLETANTFVKEHFPEREVTNVALIATEETEADIRDAVDSGLWGMEREELSALNGDAFKERFEATERAGPRTTVANPKPSGPPIGFSNPPDEGPTVGDAIEGARSLFGRIVGGIPKGPDPRRQRGK